MVLRYSGSALGAIGAMNISVGFRGTDRADWINNQVDSYDGSITSRKEALNKSIDSLNDQIDRMNQLLDMKEQQMIAQWTRMETTLSKLQQPGKLVVGADPPSGGSGHGTFPQ